MPKYTFLIPAYKGKFLDEMLHSILSQTYTDFKVIISDDCSPEDLKSICKPYLRDSRFTYRRNGTNMGCEDLVSHWNLLVNMCDTEYLVMASDDDVYEQTFLSEIDKLAMKYSQVNLIRSRVKIIDNEGSDIKRESLYMEYASQLSFISQYEYFGHIECVANCVYKTYALKEKGGFVNFPLAWISDTATGFVMSERGVANTKDILFSFRMSGLNISSEEKNKERLKKKFHAVMMFNSFFDDFAKNIEARNIEEELLLETIKNYHKYQHIKNAALYYSKGLSLKELILFISRFRKENFLNKYEIYKLVKTWLHSRLK